MLKIVMKKMRTEITKNREFGKRLAQLRKAKGFTQDSLAKILGISKRMVAYYEVQTDFPPAHLLPRLCNVLNISSDKFLGLKLIEPLPKNGRFLKRLTVIERLPEKAQKKILQYIDDLARASSH